MPSVNKSRNTRTFQPVITAHIILQIFIIQTVMLPKGCEEAIHKYYYKILHFLLAHDVERCYVVAKMF